MAFYAKIYGSNTDILDGINIKKYPLITEVTALPDLVSLEIPMPRGLFAGLEIKSETKNLWSGGERVENTAKKIYKPESTQQLYSSGETDILEQWQTLINKKFWWLDIGTYHYRPTSLVGVYTKLIAVNIMNWEIQSTDNKKTFTTTCKERP